MIAGFDQVGGVAMILIALIAMAVMHQRALRVRRPCEYCEWKGNDDECEC